MNDFTHVSPPPPMMPYYAAHLSQPSFPYNCPPPPPPLPPPPPFGDGDNLNHEDLEEAVLKGERCDSKDMYRVP